MPQSIHARLAFWQRLHERLAALSNRIDAAAQTKILGDIQARIPMVTPAEQRELQLQNAKAEEQAWSTLLAMGDEMIAGHEKLSAAAAAKAAEVRTLNETSAPNLERARERIDRLAKGEDVSGGLGKPMTREDLIAKMGVSKRQVWRMEAIAALASVGLFEEMLGKTQEASHKAMDRVSDAIILQMIRDHIKPPR